jgi:NAD(P)-dependent dehydrogenase (short-subunit alcohol dehydrogenase family)
VTKPASIETFFSAAESNLGPIDVVISNAGIGRPGLLHELSEADIRDEIGTNLFGAMFVARRAIPSMRERKRGDLVFVSSMTVVEPRPYQSGYAAAKAGVEALARTLAKELEGTGVRTTTVRLGPTRSEFGLGWNPEVLMRVIDCWKEWGLMRHMEILEPEDVAAAIVHAVTAPPGFATDVIQLNPDGSSRS